MSRTTRIAAVAVAAATVLAGLAIAPGQAQAATTIPAILFPVDGPVSYTDTFGAPRAGHTHEGEDLMGKKLQPLLAVADAVAYIPLTGRVGSLNVAVAAAIAMAEARRRDWMSS